MPLPKAVLDLLLDGLTEVLLRVELGLGTQAEGSEAKEEVLPRAPRALRGVPDGASLIEALVGLAEHPRRLVDPLHLRVLLAPPRRGTDLLQVAPADVKVEGEVVLLLRP